MSTITIKLDTTGDSVKNGLTFVPSMTDPDMKATTIYMPPTFKLSDSLIKKAVKESTSVKEVLTSPSMFHALVSYSTDRAKGYKRISLEEAEKNGIIESNYNFMLNLWLKNGQRIFIDDRAYDIISSTITSSSMPKTNKRLQFSMVVSLRVIESKRNSVVNRMKMSCDDKRDNINKIYEELYGVPFFGRRAPSTKQAAAPVMYSGPKTGIATSASPKKTPPKTNPYAPYPMRVHGVAPYGMMPAAFPVAYAFPQPQQPQQQQQQRAATVGGSKKNATRRRSSKARPRASTARRRA